MHVWIKDSKVKQTNKCFKFHENMYHLLILILSGVVLAKPFCQWFVLKRSCHAVLHLDLSEGVRRRHQLYHTYTTANLLLTLHWLYSIFNCKCGNWFTQQISYMAGMLSNNARSNFRLNRQKGVGVFLVHMCAWFVNGYLKPTDGSVSLCACLLPLSLPVEMHLKFTMRRSRPSCSQIRSMMRIICRASMSCLRSSPT